MPSRIENEVKRILKELGIKTSWNGYHYWPYAVEEAVKRGELNYRIYIDIYGAVAEKFCTTKSRVERSMRTVTDSCQARIRKHFNVEVEKITNKEFLALLVERVNERRKKK